MVGHTSFLLVCLISASWAKQLDQIYNFDKLVVYTGPNYIRDHLISVEGKRSLAFRVRACSHAHVLMSQAVQHDNLATEIVLTNGKTVVKSPLSGTEHGSVNTSAVLHCNEMRTFWISWAYGYFRLGKGPSVGVEMLLEIPKSGETNHDVSHIEVSTADGHSGVWEFDENTVMSMMSTISSGGVASIWRTVQHAPGHYYFFSVKAFRDVVIMLGSQEGTEGYTIHISADSSYNFIKKGNKVLAENTKLILDGGYMRTFWVSWWQGRITLGQGSIKYKNIVLDATDTGIEAVDSLGFAAPVGSVFNIIASTNEVYTVFTENMMNDQYTHWMHVNEGNYATFLVQACSEVHIALSKTMGAVASDTLKLVIGGAGNSRIALMDGDAEIGSQTGSGWLSCDSPTPYWINFNGERFRIGSGTVRGYQNILSLTTAKSSGIQGLGFASKHETGAHWTFPAFESGTIQMTTEANTNVPDTWIAGQRTYYKEFGLDSCSSLVTITFSPVVGSVPTGSSGSFHIILGYGNITNNVSVVRRTPAADTILATNTWPELMVCNNFKSYYISWYEGEMILGTGDLVGGHMLVRGTADYTINAVSLQSSKTATWRMDMETGEHVSFRHPDGVTNGDYKWVKISPKLTRQRFWVTGSSVKILLATTYNDPNSRGYRFEFSELKVVLFRDGKQVAESAGDIMAVARRTMFIFSWEKGVIQLLQEMESNIYINYQDSSPLTIAAIAVNPGGQNTEFRMPNTFGSELAFMTSYTRLMNAVWLELPHLDNIVFTVKMPKNAEIILAPYMYQDDIDHFYRVILGSDGNSKTSIIQDGKTLAEISSPNILSRTESRTFWVQWYHGEIAIGRGNKVGTDVILSMYDPTPAPITAASFTGDGETGFWTVGLVPSSEGANIDGPTDKPSGSGLSGGAVAGIVIGCLLLAVLIGGFAYVYMYGTPDVVRRNMPSAPNIAPRSRLGSNTSPPQSFNNPISYPETQPSAAAKAYSNA